MILYPPTGPDWDELCSLDDALQLSLSMEGRREDRGPLSLIEIDCAHCQGEGRVIRLGAVYEPGCGHPHMGDVDEGPCRVCDETGRVWIDAMPMTVDDLAEMCGDVQ